MADKKYQFKSFSKYPHIIQGISTKAFGSMKKEDGELDYDNLEHFRKLLEVKEKAVCMKQIHSGNVSIVKDDKELRIPETDGLITNKKNIPLAVLTADCLPILFYDPEQKVIAVVHAGYKGLLNYIIKNIISVFISTFKSEPEDILIGIGPSIETKCYEVGRELIKKFESELPTFKKIYSKKARKSYLDLREIALQCLKNEGILKEHIEVMDICTKCDERFYSYRGGDRDKRFASIISLI